MVAERLEPIVERPPPLVGETREYSLEALEDGLITAEDIPIDTDRSSTAFMFVTAVSIAQDKVRVDMVGSASNPLVNQGLGPFIDWCYVIIIDASTATPTYEITGNSGNDDFPAYEVYVNDQEIHKFNPSENNPFLLVGNCGDVLVPLTSGSLE